MDKNLAFADYLVFIIYFIVVAGYGYSIYRKRKKNEHDAKAYFLAEGTLTWWAIGASLIASNISAEQFIGMSGEGFFLGIAVAAYEWIAAIALIIIVLITVVILHCIVFSLSPSYVDFTDAYFWPYSSQPLYFSGIFNPISAIASSASALPLASSTG